MSQDYVDHLITSQLHVRRRRTRPVKWSLVGAMGFHVLAFALVLPASPNDFLAENREIMVIKRYEPPPPAEKPKPVLKKRASLVPIPDPTPDEPEILMDLDREWVQPVLDVDAEWVAGMPTTMPEPAALAEALSMDTADIVPPRLRKRVKPEYESTRARRGVQGSAEIEIVINEIGEVGFARIIAGTNDDELDRLALVAVHQWEFDPATLNGATVPVRAFVTINYRIY